MDGRIVTGIVAGVLLLGIYWLEASGEFGQGFPEEYAKGPEARAWLSRNESESALASNRFAETASALQFVRRLYNAGATRVIVPEQCISDDGVESYADALVVTLPSDLARRAQVWRLCAEELAREGADAEDDPNANRVFLWWD